MKNIQFRNILSVFILANVFVFFYVYLFADVDRTKATEIIIALIGLMNLVTNYDFGSSRGSAAKQEQINEMKGDGRQTVNVENADSVNQVSPLEEGKPEQL